MLSALEPDSKHSSVMLASLGGLSDDARERLDQGVNVRTYLDRLLNEALSADGVTIIARMLPRKYAIAWACDCFEAAAAGQELDPIERSGLSAAKRWLADPTEEHRRAAMDLAERLGYATPGAWLAAAAGWAEGSLAPPDVTAVPPPDTLAGEAVSAALKLLAAADREHFTERLEQYARRALDTFAPAPGERR
jgi:hypothetical protein